MDYLLIAAVSFSLSFLFSLGGLGSAVALIPVLVFLGVPFSVARPAGLFTNFISTLSATVHNLKEGLIDFKLSLPILILAVSFAPLGAYASTVIPEKVVGIAFTLFLFFAAAMAYLPKKELFDLTGSRVYPLFVGALSGFISGLLGIGGGGLIAPLMIVGGYNPKKVVPITAFVVVFSSLSAFLAYLKLGKVDWAITLSAAVPAMFAGYVGALITHRYLNPSQVKKLLGLIFIILGIKFLTKFF
ncbi:sulfite exporter TauE/SafE family protein [Thermovibrio sp.]